MIDLNRIYALEMMRKRRLDSGDNVAKFSVTTTGPAQTLSIRILGFSAPTDVDWGDTISENFIGSATRSHTYANAGTYVVKIMQPENVTNFDLRDSKVTLFNSADIKSMVNMVTLYTNFLSNAVSLWNFSDLSKWRPTSFTLVGIGFLTGTLNSADIKDWAPNVFMAGGASFNGQFDTAHLSSWNPQTVSLNKALNLSLTISPNSIKNWRALNYLDLRTRTLTQPQVDLILWEMYQISRTATGGVAYVGILGNAAPSGTFQACQSPPVSAATPGKEIAYELLNDSIGVGFNKWATVQTN